MRQKIPGKQLSLEKSFFERCGVLMGFLALVTVTLALYWPVRGFEFINFDDPIYVTDNPQVENGITLAGLKWAFTTREAANWHPLSWLSHMLDCQLFGVNAGPQHVVNLEIHIINACLLFVLLMQMTGRCAASWVVAALFAWHPLHVESVAWIAERKDVLSTFFGLLTLLAYTRYARAERRPAPWYLVTLVCFMLGLLCKPMLVTFPFLMLLLDFWPLNRFTFAKQAVGHGIGRLAVEKIPFLLLAAASCVVTMWAQKGYGALMPVTALPLKARLLYGSAAYFAYLAKIFWPSHLAAYYPYGDFEWDMAAFPLVSGLLIFSIVALWKKRLGCVAVGWLWFLGMLVPVIGLVQVGIQAMADRYTYLSAVGIFIVCVFGVAEWGVKSRAASFIAGGVAAIALVACILVTQRQELYWHDSVALFSHAIKVTKNNQAAYNNLGSAMQRQGRYREAADYYKMSVEAMPSYSGGHCNLGLMLAKLNETSEAIAEFQLALKYDANHARAHYFLGNELLKQHDLPGALEHYRMGVALRPDSYDFHYQIAVVLMSQGKIAEGQQEFREVIRKNPDWVEALNNLAWSLATQSDARLRDGNEARRLAAHVVDLLHGENAWALETLAAAEAEQGNFSEAVQTAEKGAQLAQEQGNQSLAREILLQKELYQKNQPFRVMPGATDKMTNAAK